MTCENNLVEIEWRLLNVMAKRRIRKAIHLTRKLNNLGIKISPQQTGRLIDKFPDRLNTLYLRGLLTVLDCEVSDLIRVRKKQDKE